MNIGEKRGKEREGKGWRRREGKGLITSVIERNKKIAFARRRKNLENARNKK